MAALMVTEEALISDRRVVGIPLVSIVVVVFRAKAELDCLLSNLRSCDLTDAEVIVVDGGSDDGTVALIESYRDIVTRWISEPDRGIYDAMNKGLNISLGEYVLHLNAGDSLHYLPLQALRRCLADSVDVVACLVTIDKTRVFLPRLGWRSRIANTWHHQGTFYRRTAHLRYDPTYRVYGDFDLNERMRRAGCRVRLLKVVVADHSTGGASAITSRSPEIREIWRAVHSNSGPAFVPVSYLWMHLYLVVRAARRWFASLKTHELPN